MSIRHRSVRLPGWGRDGGGGLHVELDGMTNKSDLLMSLFLENDFDVRYNASIQKIVIQTAGLTIYMDEDTKDDLVLDLAEVKVIRS